MTEAIEDALAQQHYTGTRYGHGRVCAGLDGAAGAASLTSVASVASGGGDGSGEADPSVWSAARVEAASPASLAGLLAGVPFTELDFPQATAALTAVSKIANWVAGCRVKLMHQLEVEALAEIPTGSAPGPSQAQRNLAETVAVLEAATTLKLSQGEALKLLADSRTLTDTLALMSAGLLSHARVQVIVDQGYSLEEPALSTFEARLLERAPDLTRDQLYGRAHQLQSRLDSQTLIKRRARAAAGRRVSIQPAPDAMLWLKALIPAEDGMAIMHRIGAAAASPQGPGEERKLDQLKADVFIDLLSHAGVSTLGRESIEEPEQAPAWLLRLGARTHPCPERSYRVIAEHPGTATMHSHAPAPANTDRAATVPANPVPGGASDTGALPGHNGPVRARISTMPGSKPKSSPTSRS